MTEQNTTTIEKRLESRVTFIVLIIGIVVSAVLAVNIPIWQLKTEVALGNQQLKTLVDWTEKHDQAHATYNINLNSTFADIYQKIGSTFLPK